MNTKDEIMKEAVEKSWAKLADFLGHEIVMKDSHLIGEGVLLILLVNSYLAGASDALQKQLEIEKRDNDLLEEKNREP